MKTSHETITHETITHETITAHTIGLAEVMKALRGEFARAMAQAKDEKDLFELDSMDLEFQVGVTVSASAEGGVQLWVLTLGGTAGYAHESIQKVTLHLSAPKSAPKSTSSFSFGNDKDNSQERPTIKFER